MNRTIFFARARAAPFGGDLTQSQVDGINNILDEWDRQTFLDVRWLAYILATVFHETAQKMQPISEMGGDTYLRSKAYYPWYGRGLVQITWQTNYTKFGITNPADALTWPVALRVLFEGMTKGMFTGSALSHWFSPTVDDPLNARRIVNGTDRADLIAGYHRAFLAAAKAAAVAPEAAPVKPATPAAPIPPKPAPASAPAITPPVAGPHLLPPAPKPGFWAWLFGKKA